MGLDAVPLSNETSIPPDVIVVDIPLWWKYIDNLSRHWAGNAAATASTIGVWWIDAFGEYRTNNYPLPNLPRYNFPQSTTTPSAWREGGLAVMLKQVKKMDWRDLAPIPSGMSPGEATNMRGWVIHDGGMDFHYFEKAVWGYQYIVELLTNNVNIDWGLVLTQIRAQYPPELFEILAIVLHNPGTGGNLNLGDFSGGGMDLETARGIHNSPETGEKLANLSDMRWYSEFKGRPLFTTPDGETVSSNTIERILPEDI